MRTIAAGVNFIRVLGNAKAIPNQYRGAVPGNSTQLKTISSSAVISW
jgi:hypothetical protein